MRCINLIFSVVLLLVIGCSSQKVTKAIVYSKIPITKAVPFAEGVISTKENSEFSVTFNPDGSKVYFSRRAPGKKQKIYESEFKNGLWSTPIQSSFSIDRDETPSITPNGKMFFFGSERSIPNKSNKGNFDMNIWRMTKTEKTWSAPKPLPFPINDVQEEGEEWPSSNNNFLFPIDDETFYFTTMVRGSKSIKLYQTSYKNARFSEPKEVKGLFDDEKFWVYSAVVSPDNKYLFFNSFGAPGGAGGEDIFVSKRIGNKWSRATALGSEVNSKDEESSPRFSRDGKYFFFARAENLGNYEYGDWDIFYIETEFLKLEDLFPMN